MSRLSRPSPERAARPHIGRTTRSAFTSPGKASIGNTTGSPFTGPPGGGENDPVDGGPLPVAPVAPVAPVPPVAPVAPVPPIPPPDRVAHLRIEAPRPQDLRPLKIVLGVWVALSILSVLQPILTPSTGDGFTQGLNRIYPFFGYQALAGVAAFAAAYLSRQARRVSKRWALLGLLPLAVTCLLTLGLIALVLFARG